MASHYWTCRKCKYRNIRTSSRRCEDCGEQTKPKKRVPKHMATLRDDSYSVYLALNGEIHGAGRECACCGKEPTDDRNMDRDHGHDKTENTYGKPRGLLCPGDYGCNRLMAKISLVKARAIVAYLERVESHYAALAASVPGDEQEGTE